MGCGGDRVSEWYSTKPILPFILFQSLGAGAAESLQHYQMPESNPRVSWFQSLLEIAGPFSPTREYLGSTILALPLDFFAQDRVAEDLEASPLKPRLP